MTKRKTRQRSRRKGRRGGYVIVDNLLIRLLRSDEIAALQQAAAERPLPARDHISDLRNAIEAAFIAKRAGSLRERAERLTRRAA